MQTFCTHPDPAEIARCLDLKRLGAQRLEAVRIASTLLGLSKGWQNHPAVKMWAGHEGFLVGAYLPAMMARWASLGYSNAKTQISHGRLAELVGPAVEPWWWSEPVFVSHRSNLLRKKPEHYRQFWPDLPDDLPYVWPERSTHAGSLGTMTF